MDNFFGIVLVASILAATFILLPLPFSCSGGYRKLSGKFKSARPSTNTATYQTISVERGFGIFGVFTGVNIYVGDKGLHIYPMYKFWTWSMHALFLPYDSFTVRKLKRLMIFGKCQLSFAQDKLPKIEISSRFYKVIVERQKSYSEKIYNNTNKSAEL